MKTLREYIKEAEEKHVAIGHFNISNLEALHGIYNAAKTLNVPVIIGLSEGEEKFVGREEGVALVKTLRERDDYPIFLNADHHSSFASVKACIDAGFDMVIIDGPGPFKNKDGVVLEYPNGDIFRIMNDITKGAIIYVDGRKVIK